MTNSGQGRRGGEAAGAGQLGAGGKGRPDARQAVTSRKDGAPRWTEAERATMARMIAARIQAWRAPVRANSPDRIRALAMFVQAGVEFEFLSRREASALEPKGPPAPQDRRGSAADQELRILIASIRRDPSKVNRQLRRSPEGCRWLIESWRCLGRTLSVGSDWDRDERALAFDLLGTPVAFRDDRPGEDIARKNVGLLTPLPGESPLPPLDRGQLLALVRQQIEQLEARAGDLARPMPSPRRRPLITADDLRLARYYRRLADLALDRMERAIAGLKT